MSIDWMHEQMRPVVALAEFRIGSHLTDAQILAAATRSLDAIRRRSWLAKNSETDVDYRDEYEPMNEAIANIERAINARRGGAS